MCKNSLGPCALECGPSTPVTKNCVCGKRSPSILRKGMVPPPPKLTASRPYTFCEARCIEFSNHGANAGAFQPPDDDSGSKLTCAPYGGSRCRASCTARAALSGSTVGGRRSEIFKDISGNSTLPAALTDGKPSAPVTAKVGRQVLLMSSCAASAFTGLTPGANGIL